MKKLLILITFIPILSFAKNEGCASVGSAMETILFNKLAEDLSIDTSTVDEMKAKVDVLDITPISRMYAEKLARIDFDKDPDKDKTEDKYKNIYLSSYYDNEVKSITAKYTYTDKHGKKDVFIASSLMNKDECSVRFNGYITLSREF
ncbi:Shiga toxin A subunit [Citrobacter portucalensis]|uniref:Shiga toxin A subunit n=1 Tax=Citrobacter portucalensis TaxID=1639133 RepID=UPI0022E88288|nr:Shiga toxin A subunit [Citrobacter portucalensis]